MGVLRAGKEPRELIWVGVLVGCSTLASSHEPPSALRWGPHLPGSSLGTAGSWLAAQPHCSTLKRLQGAGGTGSGYQHGVCQAWQQQEMGGHGAQQGPAASIKPPKGSFAK